MDALRSIFIGFLYLALVFHPRATVHCFRPRSPSIPTRKRTPPPPSSASSSSWSSSSNATKAPFSTMKKKPISSKHKKHGLDGPPSYPTQSHHGPPPSLPYADHLPKENICNLCSIAHLPTTNEVSHNKTSSQFPTQRWPTNNMILELDQDDFASGVAQKMFEKGWTQVGMAPPSVQKVLKIHHTAETLEQFQLYQKSVKTRAAIGGDDGRLSFDGNEVLCYWSTDFPDTMAHLSTTSREILLSESGRRAHEKLHEDGVEGDSLTRAMFICRVIAGRVARQRIGGALVEVEGGRFDSLVDGQDFLVFDPRAILPCFIVVYDDDIDGDSSPDSSNKLDGPTCSMSCYIRPITN